jgi:hypothetical protein
VAAIARSQARQRQQQRRVGWGRAAAARQWAQGQRLATHGLYGWPCQAMAKAGSADRLQPRAHTVCGREHSIEPR